MAQVTETIQMPTARQVRAALASSGKYEDGWEPPLTVTFPFFPTARLAVATSTSAQRGHYYVDNLDKALDDFYGAFSLDRVQADVFYSFTWGPSRVAALRAEFGYLPGMFLAPLRREVSYAPHGVIVLLGHFGPLSGSALETWSCQQSYDVVGPDVGAMPDTLPDGVLSDVYDAWAPVLGTLATVYSYPSETWLDGVAYYRRQADGKSTTGTWQRFLSETPANGLNVTPAGTKPYETALVVTEDAGGRRGGRFGRFYLPAPQQALIGGVYSTATASDLLDSVQAAMTAVNGFLSAAITGDVETVVASALGSGENRPVRELRVGLVPDTQRRRRRSLDESYQVSPFQAI